MLSLRPLSRATVPCARVHAHSALLVAPRARPQSAALRIGLVGLRGNSSRSGPHKGQSPFPRPSQARKPAPEGDASESASSSAGAKEGKKAAEEPLVGESMCARRETKKMDGAGWDQPTKSAQAIAACMVKGSNDRPPKLGSLAATQPNTRAPSVPIPFIQYFWFSISSSLLLPSPHLPPPPPWALGCCCRCLSSSLSAHRGCGCVPSSSSSSCTR